MLKIGVLASGGGTNLQALIDNIENGCLNARIVGVVSNNKNSYALERARLHGIEACHIGKKSYPDLKQYEDAIHSFFKDINVDLLITAGFMVVLSGDFISKYENRIMNIHPSLIPAFCGKGFYGLRVHEAALEAGVKVTGATVHFADAGTDTGPIILQKAVYINNYDTAETLQKRVMEEAEWIILPEAVKLFSEGRLSIKDKRVFIDSAIKYERIDSDGIHVPVVSASSL